MRFVALLAASLCCIPRHLSLRMIGVDIPSLRFRGDNATLRCQYDMEGESLYSVKWYRDEFEFYRYMPRSPEPKHVFSDVPGVIVNVKASDDMYVQLRSLSILSSGRYRCEVSSEAPVFATVSANSSMLVIAPPKTDPVIIGFEDGVWVSGGTLYLNCTADKSYPPAELHWLVHGRMINGDLLTPYPTEKDEDELETTKLGLSLHLRPTLLSSGPVKVTCKATVRKDFAQETFVRYYAHSANAIDKLYNRETSIEVGSSVSAAQPSSLLTVLLLLLASSAAAARGPLVGT